jgi:indole-3-glycerol phosphate synthase
MFLQEIVENRRIEVEEAKKEGLTDKLEELAQQRVEYIDFGSMLSRDPERVKIIAELKKASPSKGILRKDFDPVELAQACQRGGADALSVLTEKKNFQGDIEYISEIKKNNIHLPILCKDFIIDKFQIVQAAAYGADAILLIAAILTDKELEDLYAYCDMMNLFPIIEVFTSEELDRIVRFEKGAIQINNRNLKTFEVDLKNTEKLINHVPAGRKVIAASGIKSKQDILHFKDFGADAVLIGELLMKESDIEAKLKELIS